MSYADPEKERQYRRERRRVYRERYPEKVRASTQAWREANRDKDRAATRQWAADHPVEAKQLKRRTQLRLRYGITPEQFFDLLVAQDGKCAICGGAPKRGRNLSVDHDHSTGVVRGLLCVSCNTGVGYFERPIAGAIQEYLEAHRVV